MEYYEISKLLNDSTVSKFGIKKCVEVNDLLSVLSIFYQQKYKFLKLHC